jgi:aminoglycoside/choline kinase family phosphotransferase
VLAWYGKAIALLPRLGAVALELEPFDEAFMARENAIFPEWLLGHHLQLTLSDEEQQLLAETFACLTENNLAQPQGVMHRDFHSRNLMVCGGETRPTAGWRSSTSRTWSSARSAMTWSRC